MDSWISFWLAELTEPLSSLIYVIMFVAFLVFATLGIYGFRGIPHWVIESPQTRLLRLLLANIAIVSLFGAAVLVLQSMSVLWVNRRIWFGIPVLVLLGHLLILGWLSRTMARRSTPDSGSDFADLNLLH
jgi:hypothetical protein